MKTSKGTVVIFSSLFSSFAGLLTDNSTSAALNKKSSITPIPLCVIARQENGGRGVGVCSHGGVRD